MSAPADTTTFFIGDVALDEYYTAERWPGTGDKAMIQPVSTFCGGMIANAASIHAALGGHTEFISLLNHSDVTSRLLADLADGGVGVQYMLHDPDMPDSRTIIVLVGDEHVVLIPELGDQPMVLPEAALRHLCQPGMLYTSVGRLRQLATDALGAPAVLQSLRRAGRRIVVDLDVDGVPDDSMTYLRHARIVIMNWQGARRSFGENPLPAMERWRQDHEVDVIVATRGADGVTAISVDGPISIPGIPVEIEDVTGAGDTFGAALVYAIERSWPLPTALSFANAASAFAVTQMGPRGGLNSAENILQFMDANGVPDAAAVRACLGGDPLSG